MLFIYDIIDWLMLNFLSPMWTLMVKLLEWVQDFVLITIPNAIWAMLPDGITQLFDSINLNLLDSIIDTVTWFIPFWTIMKLYFIAIGISAGIRLVRYIIGWVPTLDG